MHGIERKPLRGGKRRRDVSSRGGPSFGPPVPAPFSPAGVAAAAHPFWGPPDKGSGRGTRHSKADRGRARAEADRADRVPQRADQATGDRDRPLPPPHSCTPAAVFGGRALGVPPLAAVAGRGKAAPAATGDGEGRPSAAPPLAPPEGRAAPRGQHTTTHDLQTGGRGRADLAARAPNLNSRSIPLNAPR